MQDRLDREIVLIQKTFEIKFTKYYLERYISYCNQDREYDEELFEGFSEITWDDFNVEMKHFGDKIDSILHGDGLGVGIYNCAIQNVNLILCVMDTDGDNGWLFIFSEDEKLLTAGYTYIDIIEWISSSTIESYLGKQLDGLFLEIDSIGNSAIGDSAVSKTIWSKPLEEAEAIAKYRIQAWEESISSL